MRQLATSFTKRVSAPHVYWRASALVRKRESSLPVTAERGAQQTKQRLVLIDGQKLPIALRPAFRREIETHYSDFSEKWFCHGFLLHRVKLSY